MLVLKDESQAEFDTFREQMFLGFAPANMVEAALVDNIVATQWKLRRIDRLESEELFSGSQNLRLIERFSIHAARLGRSLVQFMKLIQTTQDARRKLENAQLEEAMLIRIADLRAHRETDLSQFGFDLTLPRLDQLISRKLTTVAASQGSEMGPIGRAA